MIQTTLFYYFTCNNNNESLQPPKRKPVTLKQYQKKRNLILEYFKPKEKKEKKENKKVFDLILVDIKNTLKNRNINRIKKYMYEVGLKYVVISYRWGECVEQLAKTPHYNAHITPFLTNDLMTLCFCITYEPYLKEIPYLWIDAISADQQNHSKKKVTILKMNQIYNKAAYILAVPDLHTEYLRKNRANKEMLDLIQKYNDIIHRYFNVKHATTDFINDIKSISSNTTQHINNDHHSVIQS